MKLEGFFASSRAAPADPVARGEDWGPLAGRFQASRRFIFSAAFWRERKENSNLAWTKVWRCGAGNQPTKLRLSDTEIVADFEQGNKAILLF